MELPAGAVRVAPIESSVDGTIAFPPSDWGGTRAEGLVLTLARGKVTAIRATTGREAVDLAERLKPDLVILDLSMPDLNGLEATRRIRAGSDRCEVLVLTVNQASQTVRDVLAAGARGYLLKSDLAHDLVVRGCRGR